MSNVDDIRIGIVSPPDRNKLTAELMVGNEQWAELNQEQDEMLVEFYPRRDGQPWVLPFPAVMQALADAKQRLGTRKGAPAKGHRSNGT